MTSDLNEKITALEAECDRLLACLKAAVWSDVEYVRKIEKINEELLNAPTVNITVVTPDRDYSTMSPKDCYEAGLMDGVYQARETIKQEMKRILEGDA